MKTALLHVDDHDSLPAMLQAALLVARHFGGHVEGLHVRPGVARMVPMGPEGAGLATTDLVESLEREGERVSVRMRAQFDQFMRDHDVALAAGIPPSDEPTASWGEAIAVGEEALACRGRAFDLLIAGRPVPGRIGPRMGALESALFESGRPVLVVPPEVPAGIGQRIVINWNGSTETARTVGFGMPFLLRAEEVLVISVEEGMVPGPSSREVVQGLIRNGVPARAKHVECGGRGAIGETILDACTEMRADLLLKGAYTQSRLRQMIFGGATSHILGAATLPVLMAH
jgi:nucleotide-binding universal stress UspA family protein